jgi:hypothetical protein
MQPHPINLHLMLDATPGERLKNAAGRNASLPLPRMQTHTTQRECGM